MNIRLALAAALAAAAVLSTPTAQADNGVGHSGKGQPHNTAQDFSPTPPSGQHVVDEIRAFLRSLGIA